MLRRSSLHVLSGFWREFEIAWSRPTWSWRRAANALTILVGAAIACGIFSLGKENPCRCYLTALAGAVIGVVGGLGFWWERIGALQRLPLTWLGGAAVFQILLFGFGAQSVDFYRQDLAALARVLPVQKAEAVGQQRWLSIGGMEPSWVHYLGEEIVEVTESAADPQAWQRVEEFVERFPEGRLIAVGDAKSFEEFLRWQNSHEGPRLDPLVSTPRFLRAGELHILEKLPPMQKVSAT